MDSSQLASSLAGIPEQVAIPTSGYLPDPEIEPMSLVSTALEGRFFFFFFYHCATWEVLLLQLEQINSF